MSHGGGGVASATAVVGYNVGNDNNENNDDYQEEEATDEFIGTPLPTPTPPARRRTVVPTTQDKDKDDDDDDDKTENDKDGDNVVEGDLASKDKTDKAKAANDASPPSASDSTLLAQRLLNHSHDTADAHDTLLSMSFNQDGGCLAVGTEEGFRILNVWPFQETFRRVFGNGIGRVEMLYRCNLMALVGGGTSPRYPPNRVAIWDDFAAQVRGELQFRQRVLNVALRRDRIVVCLRDRIYLYDLAVLALLDTIPTCDNPLGLLSVSAIGGGGGGAASAETTLPPAAAAAGGGGESHVVLACPSVSKGKVRIELYGYRKTILIDAHESPLAALTLTVDGALLATASERGTVIRLFDTTATTKHRTPGQTQQKPLLLREFRRGMEKATISCLSFSLDAQWLALCSDRGTVHVFHVVTHHHPEEEEEKKAPMTTKPATTSSSSFFSSLAWKQTLVEMPRKYLSLDDRRPSSVAQVRGIPHPHVVTFCPDRPHTLAVAGMDEWGNGCLLLAALDLEKEEEGGVQRVGYYRFFKRASTTTPSGPDKTSSSLGTVVEDGKTLYVGEEQVGNLPSIVFGEEEEEGGFVPVDTVE